VLLAFLSCCLAGRTVVLERKLKDSKPGFFHFKGIMKVCVLQLTSLSQAADRLLDPTAGRIGKLLTSRKTIFYFLNTGKFAKTLQPSCHRSGCTNVFSTERLDHL